MAKIFNPGLINCPICNSYLESMKCIPCNIDWVINQSKECYNGISNNKRKITITHNGN